MTLSLSKISFANEPLSQKGIPGYEPGLTRKREFLRFCSIRRENGEKKHKPEAQAKENTVFRSLALQAYMLFLAVTTR
jgi:hypothetical protein